MANQVGIKNVVIAIAMEAEAKPFIDHLGLTLANDFFPAEAPFLAFQGSYNSCQLTVVTNGKDTVHGTGMDNVGTVPAALATFLTLQKMKGQVDLLINAGTCGGFSSKGAEIGDAFLTSATANHDRRIPIPPYIPYGVGKVQSVSTQQLASAIGAKTGICSTGNSLDMHDIDHHHIKNNDASVKDMEAAAIAWACELHDTPNFCVKVVTDIVDGDKPTEDEFMENLHSASVKLQQVLPLVIDYVCGKEHSEL
jgi:5'-methylthioadenosine nucleosidase